MKTLSITLTFAGLAMFCVGQVVAQTGGGGATGSGVGGQGSSVPAPASSSAGAGGNLSAPSLSQPAGGSMSSGAGTMNPATPSTPATQSPNTLQNPLTAQGSGGNVEAGQNNQLKGYGTGGFGADQAQQQNVQRVNPSDPRLVRFNNEWWYWMPGDYWVYYRNNNWSRYDPYAFQPLTADMTRYQTGYRGPSGLVYYLDENGLRYRRSYAPEMPKGPTLEAARPQGNTQGNNQTINNTQATIGGAVRGQQGPSGAEIGGAVRND